jgi:hypothetical protein
MWSNWNTHLLLAEVQNGAAIWKTGWKFLTKLNTFLLFNPAITLFGIYPNELKAVSTQKTTHRYL